jgi:protein-tyrosine phosphatase
VVHGPFLLAGLVAMRLFHLRGRESRWDQVAPNLWVGRRPMRSDRPFLRGLSPVAVVDLCAELPASRALEPGSRYLALPVLDAEAPTEAQLEEGVRWLEEHLPRGPVLVHCALGHSRSATLAAAWRMAREDLGATEAERELRRARPGVWFTPAQHAALATWRARLLADRAAGRSFARAAPT